MSTSLHAEQVTVASRISQPEAPETPSDRFAPLILLADDSKEDTAFYAEALMAAGFRVQTAASGSEAVALARCLVPDLIVMDLEMPGIDGWEATKLLGGHEHTVDIPVVAFSGFHGTAIVMRAIGAGCIGFVPKPCLAEELLGVVRSTLERARVTK